MLPFSSPLISKIKNPLLVIKVLHIIMLVSMIFYGSLLYRVFPKVDLNIFPPNAPGLNIILIVLSIVALLSIANAYYFPRLFGRRIEKNEAWYMTMHIIRMSLFESVGIFGLILGVLGVSWYLSLPFLVVSFITLLLSFPTKEKWEKITKKQSI